MAEGTYGPGWHETNWRLQAGVHTQNVPIHYFVTKAACDAPDRQVHVYTGLGEGRHAVVNTVVHLARLGVPAVGVHAPFYRLESGYREHWAKEVSPYVAGVLSDTPVHVVGRSLGGLHAINGPATAPERFASAATVSSAGLTYDALPEQPLWRLMHFGLKLGLVNAALSRPHIGNALQLGGVAYELWQYRQVGGTIAALHQGIGASIGNLTVQSAQAIHERNELPHHHWLARRDPALTAAAAQRTLGAMGCGHFSVVDGVHTCGRSRAGKDQMVPYAAWVMAQLSQATVRA